MAGKAGHRGYGYIRKLPTRRYQASFVFNDQRYYAPSSFGLRSDAELWLAQQRKIVDKAAVGLEKWLSPKERRDKELLERETLDEYAKRWIEQRNLKPRTKIHYHSIREQHFGTLSGRRVRDIDSEMIRTWYAKTLVDKKTMRSHAYQLLHAIFKTAVDDGRIDKNPVNIPGAGAVKRNGNGKNAIPVEEVAELAERIAPKFKALILLAAWTGARYGELAELRVKDVVLEDGSPISINISRGFTHREGKCLCGDTKTANRRKAILPPHVREDIAFHLLNYVAPGEDSLLFAPVRGGCHLSEKVLRDALKDVGYQGRIHDFRAFSATQVARIGTLRDTMNHLGHTTVTASLIYQQQVKGRDHEIARQLSELANGKH